MDRVETYFQDLTPLSHASQVGVTFDEVMPVHIARLMGQACGLVPTWHDVAPGWPESCQAYWCDLVAPTTVARLTGHIPYDTWVLVG
jgi:hypothetical protein